MPKTSIKIHDKFSVVIETAYHLAFKKRKSEFTAITYLFFPNTLNINERKYPKTKFYNDVRLFLKYNINYNSLDELNIGEASLLKRQFILRKITLRIMKRKVNYFMNST